MNIPSSARRSLPSALLESPTALFGLCLGLVGATLWVGELPIVDLPQHLHLISVLQRLDDPSTLYPETFARREGFTPYLGYYYAVIGLTQVLPLEDANRLVLCLFILGWPLSLAFLLRSLSRSPLPALLTLPFAFGDNFAWGFINYLAAVPLTFLCCGAFLRSLSSTTRRWWWALASSALALLTLAFHPLPVVLLGLALPLLLLTTGIPEDASLNTSKRLWARTPALLSFLPALAVFTAWAIGRLRAQSSAAAGDPLDALGPAFSPENLHFPTTEENFEGFFYLIGNVFHDGSDTAASYLALAVGLGVGITAHLRGKSSVGEGRVERWRLLIFAGFALYLYFVLPAHIHRYMYFLNYRLAAVAAALFVAATPVVERWSKRVVAASSLVCSIILAIALIRGFTAFAPEQHAIERLALATEPRPTVMSVIYDPGSPVVTHTVHFHAGATIARLRGGAPDLSFAVTSHSPVKYVDRPPPPPPSKWPPEEDQWVRLAQVFDYFLVIGAHPSRAFGERLGTELEVVTREGDFWLLKKR